MCGNWNNKFGELIVVGNFTKAKGKLPFWKDLAKIMKFCSFSALVTLCLVPLCAQKVGTTSASASSRGG